jgi:hypothetical protein
MSPPVNNPGMTKTKLNTLTRWKLPQCACDGKRNARQEPPAKLSPAGALGSERRTATQLMQGKVFWAPDVSPAGGTGACARYQIMAVVAQHQWRGRKAISVEYVSVEEAIKGRGLRSFG